MQKHYNWSPWCGSPCCNVSLSVFTMIMVATTAISSGPAFSHGTHTHPSPLRICPVAWTTTVIRLRITFFDINPYLGKDLLQIYSYFLVLSVLSSLLAICSYNLITPSLHKSSFPSFFTRSSPFRHFYYPAFVTATCYVTSPSPF